MRNFLLIDTNILTPLNDQGDLRTLLGALIHHAQQVGFKVCLVNHQTKSVQLTSYQKALKNEFSIDMSLVETIEDDNLANFIALKQGSDQEALFYHAQLSGSRDQQSLPDNNRYHPIIGKLPVISHAQEREHKIKDYPSLADDLLFKLANLLQLRQIADIDTNNAVLKKYFTVLEMIQAKLAQDTDSDDAEANYAALADTVYHAGTASTARPAYSASATDSIWDQVMIIVNDGGAPAAGAAAATTPTSTSSSRFDYGSFFAMPPLPGVLTRPRADSASSSSSTSTAASLRTVTTQSTDPFHDVVPPAPSEHFVRVGGSSPKRKKSKRRRPQQQTGATSTSTTAVAATQQPSLFCRPGFLVVEGLCALLACVGTGIGIGFAARTNQTESNAAIFGTAIGVSVAAWCLYLCARMACVHQHTHNPRRATAQRRQQGVSP